MRRTGLIALLLAAACASTGGPRTLAKGAIDAAGGKNALAAIRSYHIAGEGDYEGMAYTAVVHYREPGDWRWDMTSEGLQMSQLVLGSSAYASSGGGKAIAQEGKTKGQMLSHVHIANCALLPDRLLAPDVSLERAAKVMFEGAECPALRARFEGGEVAIFVFDPKSGLVRQVHFDMRDEATGRMVPAVTEFSDYETVGDVRVATRLSMSWGTGATEKSLRETRGDFRWNPDIPANIFAEPELAPPTRFAVREMPPTRVVEYTFVGTMAGIGRGVAEAMEWVTGNGGVASGPPSMIWRKLPTDPTNVETVIQLPVRMESAPASKNARLLKRPPFRFAYASYEGHVSGCRLLFGQVTGWIERNGYRIGGPMRVIYLTRPDAEGTVRAEVGFPVARRRG